MQRDSISRRRALPTIHSLRGEIALAEGRTRDALLEFARADTAPDGRPVPCAYCYALQAARAYDAAGIADSAIVHFESYLATPQRERLGGQTWWLEFDPLGGDPVWLAHVYRRLDALHERRGARDRSRYYESKFLELWKNADPALQPQVAKVRANRPSN